MKAKYGLLGFLLFAGSVSAAVYKWVDDHGNVHYGDLPPGEAPAEPMNLPGVSTYKYREVPAQPKTAAPPKKAFSGYTQIEITEPAADSAVRANDQKVLVLLTLVPPLQEGHLVSFSLDGKAIGKPSANVAVELTNVTRGGHSVQATVLDATGKQVGQSTAVQFTLRKASIIKPQAPTVTPPPAPIP